MIKQLCIFDFDATLFLSPMFPDDWGGHTGDWFDTLQSLTPPCVIDPGPLWVGSSVSAAAEMIADPESYVVLMTGRGTSPELEARVSELVSSVGLSFDEIHLKPGGPTMSWKSSMLEQFINKFPDLQTVQVWEDRSGHLDQFIKIAEEAGLEAIPHFVGNVLKDPCVLNSPIEEAALRRYIRGLLIEVNEYVWNKADRKTMGQDGKAKGRQKKNWVGQDTSDVIVNWYKKMGLAEAIGLLSEGVEFREVDSPLKYGRSGNVKRIAYCDAAVTEPPSSHDAYFKEWEKWRKHSKGGKRLKKPVLDEIVPGVSDVCIIGFLDYHKETTVSTGATFWYIDYMKTRGDSRGTGVASKLVEQFYETVAQPGDYVNFGKMMQKEVGHLKDKMEKKYPDIKTKGAEYF
jgi:hypothetical protein